MQSNDVSIDDGVKVLLVVTTIFLIIIIISEHL